MGLEEILKELGADIPFDENGGLTPNGADAWEKLINVVTGLNNIGAIQEKSDDMNMILWNELKKHRGHKVSIVSYGDWNNPEDVCLECEDCGEVVLDAEIYTLCAREDN